MSSLALLALSFDDPLPLNSFFEGAALRATPAYVGGVCAAQRLGHLLVERRQRSDGGRRLVDDRSYAIARSHQS